MIRSFAFLLLAASLLGAEHADHVDQSSCPWLDPATAAGALGGPVNAKVTPMACEFVRQQPRGRSTSHKRSTVSIEVRRSPDARHQFSSRRAHCGGAAVPLKAIGNEAFLCAQRREVVGRVRDALFIVRNTAPDRTASAWESVTKELAAEVAGALF